VLDFLNSLQFLLSPPWLYYWGGTTILFAVVLLVLVKWRREHQGIVPFRASGGKVEIAPHTIRSVIKYAVETVEGVEQVVVATQQKGSKIAVTLKLHLLAAVPLKQVDAEIKRRIRKALVHQFGMEQIDPIHLKITKIVGDPRPVEEVELEAENERPMLPRFDEEVEEAKVHDDYDEPLPEERR